MLFLRLDLRYQELLASDVEILHAGDRNGRERPPVEGSRGDEQEVFIVTEYLFIEHCCSIDVAEKKGNFSLCREADDLLRQLQEEQRKTISLTQEMSTSSSSRWVSLCQLVIFFQAIPASSQRKDQGFGEGQCHPEVHFHYSFNGFTSSYILLCMKREQ